MWFHVGHAALALLAAGGVDADNLVHVRLQAAAPSAAGADHLVAVHFAIAEGWHIYWRNPGETGMATRVSFTLPNGARAGQTRYQTPHVFTGAGGATSAGYEHTATLFTPVSVPPSTAGALTVKARWLACTPRQCVPGKATVNLPWPPKDAGAALWQQYRRSVPVAPVSAPVWHAQPDGTQLLTVPLPSEGPVQFVPDAPTGVACRSEPTLGQPTSARVRCQHTGSVAPDRPVAGVLLVDGKTPAAVEFAVPWPL